MRIYAIEDTSTESMYGRDPDATRDVDTAASEARYLEMLADAIHAAYPEAEVEVEGRENGCIPGTQQHVELNGGEPYADDDEDIESIDNIRHEVWESWDWVVYTS